MRDIIPIIMDMEIIELCLNTPDEASLDGEWVEMMLFDGVGYGITKNLDCVCMRYPKLSELTKEMLDKAALYRFGSTDWYLEPGGSPEYSDAAIAFGKCQIISAGRYAKELTQQLLTSQIRNI